MNPTPDDRRIARLIGDGANLDPNLIAAYIDGGLSPAERLALERRIAADPEAQLLARALQERSGRRALWLPVAAIAAAVLVGVLVWARRDATTPATLDERLASVVAALRTEGGEPFADFAVLSDDELTTVTGSKRGGGGAWLHPRGLLMGAPQTLRWRRPDGCDRVHVTVRGPGVNWAQDVEGAEVAAPPLAAGRFVVTMRALDSMEGQLLRRSFVVVDEAERAGLEKALQTIRAKAPDDLEDLVVAHFAARQRLYDIARASAQRAVDRGGNAKSASERLLQHLTVIQGR